MLTKYILILKYYQMTTGNGEWKSSCNINIHDVQCFGNPPSAFATASCNKICAREKLRSSPGRRVYHLLNLCPHQVQFQPGPFYFSHQLSLSKSVILKITHGSDESDQICTHAVDFKRKSGMICSSISESVRPD